MRQLRTRAAQFESGVRRRNLRDQIGFGLLAIICVYGVLLDGVVVRVGCALMLAWALFSMFTLHRFGSVSSAAADSSAQTCAVWHQKQLERQRDIALSWPWGIGLALPGFILTVLGLGVRSRFPGIVIFGKAMAAKWQREIDSLRSMTDEAS